MLKHTSLHVKYQTFQVQSSFILVMGKMSALEKGTSHGHDYP